MAPDFSPCPDAWEESFRQDLRVVKFWGRGLLKDIWVFMLTLDNRWCPRKVWPSARVGVNPPWAPPDTEKRFLPCLCALAH